MLKYFLRKIFINNKSPRFQVLNSILLHNKEYFSKYPRLQTFSKEGRENVETDLIKTVNSIFDSKDPVLQFRKHFVDYVIELAYYIVLSLTEEDKQESYSKEEKISGELSTRLIHIAGKEAKLAEPFENQQYTNEDLLEYCRTRRILLTYYVNGLNLVRMKLNDYMQDDWLKPFLINMCIWQEDVIRINSNLPRFIESDTESLLYSSFFNIVENGYADPLSEWNSVAKKILPEDGYEPYLWKLFYEDRIHNHGTVPFGNQIAGNGVRELNKSNVEHVITEYRYRIDYYAPVTNQDNENLKLFDSAAVLIEEFKLPENTDEIHSVILGLNSFLGHKRMRIRKMKAIEIFQWLLKSVIVPIVVTIITTWIIMKYFPNG